MTVNHDIKTQLAKLLATENFIVEHRDVKTAAFNVHTRVLSLPLWKLASNTVYDVLVAHECSHALFTPNEDWTLKVDLPKQFVNVVEDARIEKLMKRKYPGLAKTFYHGYQELNDDDFFDIDDEDINTFNLADRINLHFKVGHFVDVAFSPSEKPIVRIVEGCETFEDVLFAAELLHKFCKKEEEKPLDNEEVEEEDYGDLEDESEGRGEPEDPVETKEEDPEPEVKTDSALNENLKDLNDTPSRLEDIYCEVPEINLDSVIVSHEAIHDKLNLFFEEQFAGGCDAIEVDLDYKKFKKSAQKEVNYLVKEFECKKSSDDYSRTTVSKTGVLDCSKLHTYKYNEDLFRKVNIVPDGKNHGLIFLVDWSGSMCDSLVDTVKQLFNLIWFCRKVQIPFEVYAFTSAYNKRDFDDKGRPVSCSPHMEKKENSLRVGEDFKLINWLSSGVNKATLENNMINLWRVSASVCQRYSTTRISYWVLPEFNLSGTPLHEALISLYKIIPQFKGKNNIQKVQCIILSDGEANALPAYRYRQTTYDLEPILRPTPLKANRSFLRNRKTGHVYKIGGNFWQFTEALLKDLKQVYPDVNFIGIRVLASRDFNGFIKRYCPSTSDNIIKRFRKEKSVTITGTGYHKYFGILSSGLYNDSEFDVAPYSTKAQIKSAFVKSLQTKKLNKKVLGEFISLVA